MTSSNQTKNWVDILDETEMKNTGNFLMYRNYMCQSENEYQSKKEPVARGFTAYIAFDEVSPGILSLKTMIERKRPYVTLSFFETYVACKLDLENKKNDQLPFPKTKYEVELNFYTQHIIDEKGYLIASAYIFTEYKDEKDRELKVLLHEFVSAYIQWLEGKLQQYKSESEETPQSKERNLADREKSPIGQILNSRKKKQYIPFPDYFNDKNNKDKLAEACKEVFGKENRGKADAIMIGILSRQDRIKIGNKGRAGFCKAWYLYINYPVKENETFSYINRLTNFVDINDFQFKDEKDLYFESLEFEFKRKLSKLGILTD